MLQFNKIIFYNHCHNGDLHVSRQIVKKIISILGDKYEYIYTHKNSRDILRDLPVSHNGDIIYSLNKLDGDYIKNNILYINTWYGANNGTYLSKYNITFDCLYNLLDDVCDKRFGFKLQNVGGYKETFPQIEYIKYDISNIDKFVNDNQNKKVLVCNCPVKSAQAGSFLMIPTVNKLADSYKNTIFIITNKEDGADIRGPNVIYSSDIIRKNTGSDLNENSYISTYCNVIIGRASGPYTFCYVTNNMFREVKFLCFYRYGTYPGLLNTTWLGSFFNKKIKYKASIIDSCESDYSFEVINKYIGNKL